MFYVQLIYPKLTQQTSLLTSYCLSVFLWSLFIRERERENWDSGSSVSDQRYTKHAVAGRSFSCSWPLVSPAVSNPIALFTIPLSLSLNFFLIHVAKTIRNYCGSVVWFGGVWKSGGLKVNWMKHCQRLNNKRLKIWYLKLRVRFFFVHKNK